jgi:hypothetical protein
MSAPGAPRLRCRRTMSNSGLYRMRLVSSWSGPSTPRVQARRRTAPASRRLPGRNLSLALGPRRRPRFRSTRARSVVRHELCERHRPAPPVRRTIPRVLSLIRHVVLPVIRSRGPPPVRRPFHDWMRESATWLRHRDCEGCAGEIEPCQTRVRGIVGARCSPGAGLARVSVQARGRRAPGSFYHSTDPSCPVSISASPSPSPNRKLFKLAIRNSRAFCSRTLRP